MLAFGLITVVVLLTVVMPQLTNMLRETLPVLPLPTRLLLNLSGFFHHNWYWILLGAIAAGAGVWRYLRTTRGAELWDKIKLRLPIVGNVFRAAALGRFARTLGTLAPYR